MGRQNDLRWLGLRAGLLTGLALVAAGCLGTTPRQEIKLAFNPAPRSVSELAHCRPAETAEAMLRGHGFERDSTFIRFETWANDKGYRLVMGRMDGYLCVLGPEQGDVT